METYTVLMEFFVNVDAHTPDEAATIARQYKPVEAYDCWAKEVYEQSGDTVWWS